MNLDIWDKLGTTDPEFTKNFKKGGGFAGTGINPTYVIKKLTEEFGPCGQGWGDEIIKSDFFEGSFCKESAQSWSSTVREVVHTIVLKLWYIKPIGEVLTRFEVIGVGTTTVVGSNKYGPFTDEEYYKKTMTDALTNAAKKLGMSADIFMGRYDDSKYLEELKEKFGKLPKRATIVKELNPENCTALDQYMKIKGDFELKYGVEIFDTLSGKQGDNRETWKNVFQTAFKRLSGVPPIDTNPAETKEEKEALKLQKTFNQKIENPGDDWTVYDECAELLDNNTILDNQNNIDSLLNLEKDLTERLGDK